MSTDIAILVLMSTYVRIAIQLGLAVKNYNDIGVGIIDKNNR